MSDLLIAIAVDFTGSSWFGDVSGRIASSLLLGKAGDVRQAGAPGAWLAARDERPTPAGRPPRLRQIDAQPGPDGAFTLMAGCLFEREDLCAALGEGPFAQDSDLYAAAHRRFGDECDRRILGNYAVLQWFPGARRLRLARSPVSDHPLHVWREDGRLVASTTPRAIFAAGVPPLVNDEKLADALVLNFMDARKSWYHGISRVPYASIASHDPGGSTMREYWSFADVPAVRFKRDEDYVEAVDEQFRRAVRVHLDGVRKPGFFLSGGFDSQALISYVAEILGPDRRLKTYTGIPAPDWTPTRRTTVFGDESPHVRALAEMYPQIDPEFCDGADLRYGHALDAMHMLGSTPVHNAMVTHWSHQMCAAAADAGCDVLFDASQGNIGFSYDGLTGFPTWFRQGKWLRLIRETRMSGDHRSLWRALFSRAIWPHLPRSVHKLRDRNNPWRVSPFARWSPLRADYAARDRTAERAASEGADPDFYDHLSSTEWRDKVFRTTASDSPDLAIGFQLLHGISLRDPTSFLPLLELCAGIPDEQYLRNGETRWLARRLLKGRVPEMVRSERRRGSMAADWPLRFSRERAEILETIAGLEGDPRLAEIFDFGRMATSLRDWPGTEEPEKQYAQIISQCIGRGVSYARFVRYVEGRNIG
jgi:asparagine synthase (glutamine-hydrolysing)